MTSPECSLVPQIVGMVVEHCSDEGQTISWVERMTLIRILTGREVEDGQYWRSSWLQACEKLPTSDCVEHQAFPTVSEIPWHDAIYPLLTGTAPLFKKGEALSMGDVSEAFTADAPPEWIFAQIKKRLKKERDLVESPLRLEVVGRQLAIEPGEWLYVARLWTGREEGKDPWATLWFKLYSTPSDPLPQFSPLDWLVGACALDFSHDGLIGVDIAGWEMAAEKIRMDHPIIGHPDWLLRLLQLQEK